MSIDIHKPEADAYYMTPESRDKLHHQLVRSQTVRSCLNCEYWIMNTCEKYGEVPPPNVIVYSCPEWEPDIPF